jgi:hypothetical protein
MTRMTLTTDPVTGRVTIAYTDSMSGERRTRAFTTTRPEGPSYVIEIDQRGQYPQVCERLASTGSTLMAQRETLADVIRREYRAMRRSDAKYA